ncbi:MAG: hypothetical protein M3083_25535 [Actinomycetota bacterium]|nr:hypothetical protein [Actinomycetota bacterium]MDQ6946479.1 hypothetical protein [Actinomycetota bacterium]
MAEKAPIAAAVRLATSLEALAALAAYARVQNEELPVEPLVRDVLAEVVREILGEPQTAVVGVGSGPSSTSWANASPPQAQGSSMSAQAPGGGGAPRHAHRRRLRRRRRGSAHMCPLLPSRADAVSGVMGVLSPR